MKMTFNFMFALAGPVLAAAVEAAPAAPAFALQGRVLDSTRAPVAGARVTALPDGAGGPAFTESDADGRFVLPLDPGGYTVTVAARGFHPATQHLDARASGRLARDFVLSVAGRDEVVEVDASADYRVDRIESGTRTPTPLRDVPQAVTVTTRELIRDQLVMSLGDVLRYVPGAGVPQGENNRDQVVLRGNSSSADFFLDGMRDDVQYYRDLYNVERVEALKGPNAMIFGRGGGGGVINRVIKEAQFATLREATVQAGAYGHRRVAADVDQPLNRSVAVRLNGMYESSDSFRDAVGLERYAVNPTVTIASGGTRVVLGYERLHDTRVADRGIPSFQGRPAEVDVKTFYGDPRQSDVHARVDLAWAGLEQRLGPVTLRSRALVGDYDRGYQNFVPGAVDATRTRVALSAYNNATHRRNAFDQTDVLWRPATGPVQHTVVAGFEVGRQRSENLRQTGYFDDAATSVLVPYDAPTVSANIRFRPSATDADNHVRVRVAAGYVQDQVELSPSLQVIAGLRYDRFDLRYDNHRNGETLARVDGLLSPRAGVVFKPAAAVSVYGSYGMSYLPSSGDQFASLTTVTREVEPEKFVNYEAGVKWDLRRALSLTSAVYRLDRTNTRATDPNDPTRIVQTGSQRTDGFEVSLQGRLTASWQVVGGYAWQDASVTRATVAARAGAQVPQVPHHAFALWNHYQVSKHLALAAGVQRRTDSFAAIDNTVVLPGYTRLDAAADLALGRGLRLQANLENALDRRYYINADGNTNISPGSPRALRLALTGAF